mgnify:CR=1 FL=1
MVVDHGKNFKNMGQKVIPVGKKLLIKQKSSETKTKSGLYIPEVAQKKEFKGTVKGVGKEVTEISIGDMVQYTEHCLPTTMMHDGEPHLLIQQGDVFAILVDE